MHCIKFLCLFILLSNCSTVNKIETSANHASQKRLAKFEPADSACLFFIGQDLAATGGLIGYHDGYVDQFPTPTGVTVYTDLSPGASSFGFFLKGNDGLYSKANWGSGDNCAQCYLNDETYQYALMAIGLSLVGNEKAIASGQRNNLIHTLATWIKESKRPVFLRIGYEFDGWSWNHYNRQQYLLAWKKIHQIFLEMKVENVAFVWQSKGNGSGQDILENWYPGDDLVDWCAYSFFNNPDEEMLHFAKRHHKPVFIAEASPVLHNGVTFSNTRLTDSVIAKKAWQEWFLPFLKTLQDNKDVIKAFSYINTDWHSQPMWVVNPVFQQVDSRIQMSKYVSKKWLEEMEHPRYLKPDTTLWSALGFISKR